MKKYAFPYSTSVLVSGMLSITCTAACQGTFGNLDFELANVPFVPAGQVGADVPTSQGLPKWSAFYGAGQSSTIQHNTLSLGGAEVAILGPAWSSSDILQGSYSVLLAQSTAGAPTTAAIAQTGMIPPTATTLTFFTSPVESFAVTFSGHVIPLVQLGTGPNYKILGGDISAFAGQTGELRFTAGGGILDNIQFSSIAIPEPSVAALAVLAAMVLWRCRSLRC